MPFSSGTFTRTFDCTTDRDNGVKILASKFDTEFDGIATGLSTCILKDGTQTCTAAIPFAEGLTVPDNKTIVLGTNSDITIQYDETTNDALEIAANVEGAALGVVLKADQGDDNADQHKLNIADGGVLTLQSKISGGFVTYLTHTPNATVADSTTAVAGNLTVAGDLTLGSGAVINEAELEAIDGITAGTVAASKAVIVDSNKDIASFRNVTLTGELDAGSLDISGDADIDGTLEADAMTLNGTAITATATLDTGISNNNVPKFTSGVADNDFLRVDGTAIEGRSASEVLSDIAAMPLAGGTFSGGIDVTGTSKSDLVVVDSSGGATPTYSHTNNGESITLRYNDDSGARAADIVATGNTPAGATMAMRFFVNPNSTDAASEVMRLQNGNVGIGCTPNVELEISGASEMLRLQSTDTNKASIVGRGSSADRWLLGTVASNDSVTLQATSATGELLFKTGGTNERMRIQSGGQIFFGKTSENVADTGVEIHPGAHLSSTSSSAVAGIFNRKTDDGTIVQFRQDNTTEGTITVSGSTVSYNGGHLSRWSQATDGNRIDGLVKGTVMTNLDQMAVWHHEAQAATYYTEDDELPDGVSVGDEKTPAVGAYDEDNEQLNCMAVSSVEGDANVAGVFVNWDDDDEDYTADMNVAMTGDMVIRIAQDTTVARGDLLMSAGDGTAKPQDDDIVRSKTIAKVTSTIVSHTYDDGSYLVPCVLMAC
jgi:hypothetical protein